MPVKFDEIWAEVAGKRHTVLRASWPQDRGVYWVEDPDADEFFGQLPEAFVLADSAMDAIEEMAERNGHEGDDERVNARRATADEHGVILEAVRRFLKELGGS